MSRSIYLVNPTEDTPAYNGMEVLKAWGITNKAVLADLAMPTVAAMVPAGWEVTICDERVEPIEFDTAAQFIGITGKVSQRNRMIDLANEFRRRGKTVLIGGPYATLNPDDVRPHADILIRGEIEEIAGEIFSDLESRQWRSEYEGTKPDLRLSPVPRWDLYKRGLAIQGQVQTSRGCPFECEFCDVIQYLGRKQRWKEPEQVLEELEALYGLGYRAAFLADDNFTVMRRRARALLEALARWNSTRPAGRMSFSTQASIDIARDVDLMRLCFGAGLTHLFIGVETPNQESLIETLKRQNTRIDLVAEVRKVVAAGMLVSCGMIVGFDHDGLDIFQRQAEFISRLPVPMISLGLLVAPAMTPLYDRLKGEGRLISHSRQGGGMFLDTNVKPKLMTEEQLKSGMKWLLNQIYSPSAFGRRVELFAQTCGAPPQPPRVVPFDALATALAKRLAALGNEEDELVRSLRRLVSEHPQLRRPISACLRWYCQVRHLLQVNELWDPSLATRPLSFAA